MRRYFAVVLAVCLVAAHAQTKPATATNQANKPAAPSTGPATAAAPSSASLPSEATVESFLTHMFSYDPNLQWKVVSIKPSEAPEVVEVMVAVKTPDGQQGMRLYVLPGQKWAVEGNMMPFGADPFAATRQELEARAHGPARGPQNADLTIVEFSDLQCPSCKQAQPTIDRLLSELPNARFIFQNFPLENLHPWAFKAATYADCLGRANPDAFWKFVHVVYDHQAEVTTEDADTKLKVFAQEAGANPDQMAACAAQPATATRVRESQALGNAVGITGTPTVFLNGRKVQNVTGLPFEVLKALAEKTPAK